MEREGERIGAAGLAWSNLPSVTRYRVELRAERAQRLPPLWTTALHGALDDALYALGCLCEGPRGSDPRMRVCRGDCPYAWLCEAPAQEGDVRGVQDRAPAPLVVAPMAFEPRARFVELREDDRISLRLTLLGPVAKGHVPLVHAALQRCARTGLGIDPQRPDGARPTLALERVVPERICDDAPPREAVLETVTPARITLDGKVLGRLDGTALWRAMRRRGELLARRYGGGSLGDGGGPEAPFAADVHADRVVQVERWSSRQRRRMMWPGVMGVARLHGEGVARVWPLLAFIRDAQVGKGTSFGFGRVDITPVG